MKGRETKLSTLHFRHYFVTKYSASEKVASLEKDG